MNTVAMRRILWTCPYLPWPLTSGGRVRQFHLLSQMHRRGHAITLLVQSKTPVDDAARRALEPLLERLIVLPRRPLRSAKTLMAAATSRLPLLATVNGYAPDLSAAFDALLAQPWDVVQVEHSYSAQPFLRALAHRGRPFVLTEHNVESALGRATYGKWPGLMRPLAAYDRWRARRWERHVLSSAERVIAVTAEDALALQTIAERPTDIVGNGVDVGAFADVAPALDSARILFVGNFEYTPNVDAVEWTLAEIMPRVWLEHPHAHLVVCGFALPKHWRVAHVDPRVSWQGYVPRLQDVQRSSAVFLAPLRNGGGSKLKVLEAMAAGLPLVTTREGVSGLAVRPGSDALVADDADGLASAVASLLSDPSRAHAIGEAGRRFVRAHHDWTAAADALEAVYERVARPTISANDTHRTVRIGIDYRAVTAAPLSGIARQIRALEAVLAARPSTEVRLFTAAPHDHPHRAIASCPERPSPVHQLHHPVHRLRFERDHLPQAIEHEALDVYVATINMGLPIGRLRTATRLVLILHDPFQITLRNRHASRLQEWFYRISDRWSIGHSVRIADAIWTPSTFVADALAQLFPQARERIHVLPNAVPSTLWTTASAVRPRELSSSLPSRYWLLVGTAEPRKNVRWFIQQWRDAGGADALPRLVLVGHPADLPQSLASLDGLHFVNGLSDEELADLYRRAERLWQPSYAEGFGLPVVEAAAAGTPIASALGSSLDEITPPGSPRFDPHDGRALQSLMRRLASSPRTDADDAAQLRRWAARFDLAMYAERVDRLVSELTA